MERNQKYCKILSEFSMFLLERKINCFEIKVLKSSHKVSFIFECEMLEEKYIEEIKECFKVKRQEAIELYGWELLGLGDTENDLELASTLLNYLTYYKINGRIRFELVRYEKN